MIVESGPTRICGFMATAACCNVAPPGPDACTPPPCVPKASTLSSSPTRKSTWWSLPAITVWPEITPGQVTAPPLKPDPQAPLARHLEWENDRKARSSHRISVEHAIAEAKPWPVLHRFTSRRDLLPETINAVAGLVSDRTITW